MSTIETNILEFGQKTQGTYYFPEPVFLLSN